MSKQHTMPSVPRLTVLSHLKHKGPASFTDIRNEYPGILGAQGSYSVLANLRDKGLIAHVLRPVPHGPGRPHKVYNLTPKGEKYLSKYVAIVRDVLHL